MKALRLLMVVPMFLAACGDDDAEMPDARPIVVIDAGLPIVIDATPPPPDAREFAACTPAVQACSTAATDSYCNLMAPANAQAQTNAAGDSVQGIVPANTDATPDFVSIELYQGFGVFTGAIEPGVYDLTGEEAQYATCGACVLIHADVTGLPSAYNPTEYYMATGGTLVLDSVEGDLVGAVYDATFQRVTIDGTTYQSTPTDPACTTALQNVEFDTAIQAP
jgi:hypothetical protein